MLAQKVLHFYVSGNLVDPVGRMGEVIGSGGGAGQTIVKDVLSALQCASYIIAVPLWLSG